MLGSGGRCAQLEGGRREGLLGGWKALLLGEDAVVAIVLEGVVPATLAVGANTGEGVMNGLITAMAMTVMVAWLRRRRNSAALRSQEGLLLLRRPPAIPPATEGLRKRSPGWIVRHGRRQPPGDGLGLTNLLEWLTCCFRL